VSQDGNRAEPRQARAEQTRKSLLAAGLKAFSNYGYQRVTAKGIAAEAQQSVGTFYRYFEDKKALFLEICRDLEHRMFDGLLAGPALAADKQASRRLAESIARRVVDSHRKHWAFHREILALQLTDPDVAEMVQQREDRVNDRIKQLFRSMAPMVRPYDLKAAAQAVQLSLEALAHQIVIFKSDIEEERLIGEMSDMLARYLFWD
jgi:AcrR family transcriptional regulator